MTYFPPTGSVVAFQSNPANLQASVTGTVAVTGSILAAPQGNQSVSGTVGASIIGTVPVTVVAPSGSVVAFQGGAWTTSVVGTVGASIIGTVPVTLVTPSGSTAAFLNSTNASVISVGNVAMGTTDSGNPVKIGGRYSASVITLLDGQRGDMQLSSRGEIQINSADAQVTGSITAADAVVAAPGGAGVLVSGASTANSLIAVQCPGGDSAWVIQLTGTLGGSTFYYEESADSTNGTNGSWTNVNGRQTGVVNTVLAGNTTTAGFFRGNTAGALWIRLRAVGGAAINASVIIRVSSGPGAVFLNASIPAGSNLIGSVIAVQGGTQITSVSGLVNVSGSIQGTYAEDSAHTDGNPGLFVLGVRNDTVSSFVGTNTDYSPLAVDAAGRSLTKPFATDQASVIGHNSIVGTGTAAASVVVMQAPGAGLKNYLTDFNISNTGTTTTIVQFNDSDASIVGRTIAPAGGGSNHSFQVPLTTWSVNKAITVQLITASSVFVTVTGYKAP